MYLNRNNILSYQASLNFIVLKRGYGKSWTFKDLAISEFIKSGAETVWLRRYKPELTDTCIKFFEDIADRYPKYKLEVRNRIGYCNGKPFLYFYALSTVQRLKSVPFKNVKYLIFDEFLIEGGSMHYIPAECDCFCGFLSTVFRDRPIKAFLLGNKVKEVTPYNIYFNLPNFNGVKYINDRKTLVYAKDADGIIEENYAKSDLEKVLKGTKYYDYSLKNDTLNDSSAFICKRPKNLPTFIVINIQGVDIGMFFETEKSRIYFDTHCDTTVKQKYCLNKDNLAESYFLLSKTMPISKIIKDMYLQGRIYFNDIKTKTIVQELLDFLV